MNNTAATKYRDETERPESAAAAPKTLPSASITAFMARQADLLAAAEAEKIANAKARAGKPQGTRFYNRVDGWQ